MTDFEESQFCTSLYNVFLGFWCELFQIGLNDVFHSINNKKGISKIIFPPKLLEINSDSHLKYRAKN